jgi:hypothetical protein
LARLSLAVQRVKRLGFVAAGGPRVKLGNRRQKAKKQGNRCFHDRKSGIRRTGKNGSR